MNFKKPGEHRGLLLPDGRKNGTVPQAPDRFGQPADRYSCLLRGMVYEPGAGWLGGELQSF